MSDEAQGGEGGGDVTRGHDEQLDEELLARLRALATGHDPVPDDTVLAARSMLAHLRLDAELAELTLDSFEATEPAGVRSAALATRRLSFRAGDREVEIEVVTERDRRRLVGQCLPAGAVRVTVERPHRPEQPGPATTETDDLGRFALTVPTGPLRLRCVWSDGGAAVETAWVSV